MDRDLQAALLASLAPALAPMPPISSYMPAMRSSSSRPHASHTNSFSRADRGYGGGGAFRSDAPDGTYPSGRTFDSYRRESERTGIVPVRGSRPRDYAHPGNGKVSALERDGIKPAVRNKAAARPTPPRAGNSRRVPGAPGSGGKPPGPLVETHVSVGAGFYERTSYGAFNKMGMHYVLEGKHSSRPYITTLERDDIIDTLDSGRCNVEAVVKAARPSDGGGPSPKVSFALIMGYMTPNDHIAVVGDVRGREWRIESADGSVLQRVHDDTMRADHFYNLMAMIRGDALTVEVNGTSVFSRVRVPPDHLMGLVGFRCNRSRTVFKKLDVSPAGGGGGGGGGDEGGGGAGARGRGRTTHADSKYDDGGRRSRSRSKSRGRRRGLRSSDSDDDDEGGGGGYRASDAKSGDGPMTAAARLAREYGSIDRSSAIVPASPSSSSASSRRGGGAAAASAAAKAARAGGSSGYGQSSGYGNSGGSGSGSGRGGGGATRSVSTNPHAKPEYTGSEDPAMVEQIQRDILDTDLGVTFDDIAALDTAKRLLNEAVVLPLLVPEFFTGIREPWKGVLLFGPPGTGKTMLAKAVAGMNGTTFFNCSAASLVSKWRGESEKLVATLFAMAHHYSPSIIFIDEIDALVTARGSQTEHEASRRLKTQILTCMDGVSSKASDSIVMVLATSNTPWDLDDALRRRLEKRIYIGLPEQSAREDLFRLNLKGVPCDDDVDIETLAEMSEGYSGADVHLVCREASMKGMRRLLADKTPQQIQAMRAEGLLESPPVSMTDISEALASTRPSVGTSDLDRYETWTKEFAST